MGGINKALLEIGGSRVVERVRRTLGQVFSQILLITNTPDDFAFLELPMFRDLIPGHGSLGGLYTGLSVCTGTHGFLVACDMPFLHTAVIERLLSALDDHDVVVPRIRGHLEPLHAIYSKECTPHIRDLMTKGDLKMLNFFHLVDVQEVVEEDLSCFDPELRFIMNLNTPEDLQKARKLAEEIR